VLPDSVAKVSLLRFEKVPAKEQDLLELVRWQMRKSVPFRIEDAQLAYAAGAATPQGREFLVLVARRDVVRSTRRRAWRPACTRASWISPPATW
jgi:Tfp pilus assembly PilM family ATPase